MAPITHRIDETPEARQPTVMCICTVTQFRPTLLSLFSEYECQYCGGIGWVEEHEFTGDGHNCTVCGWSKVGHWDYEQEEGA